jgi:gliding motility-associated-like protein
MLNMPGDPSLNGLANATTFDAAIIEFDFTPQNDTVRFRYIFASEEYPEFVCSQFNDAFAFFISGPGYATPVNIAKIPGSVNPVTINNVNGGQCGSAGSGAPSILTNSNLYVNNTGGIVTEMDGYTVPLYAVASVIPCQTYHLRISIADAGDQRYESSVFFEEGSLRSAPVVDAGMNRQICPGDTVHLGGPVAVGWNYQWVPPTGLNSASSPNPVLTLPPGSNTPLLYTVTATNGSCVLRDSVTIFTVPGVTAAVSATSACLGQPVTVDLQAALPSGATMNWDFNGGTLLSGSGTGPYSILYPAPGDYTPSVTFSNLQCSDTVPRTATVSINPLPVVNAIADTVCIGDITTFDNLSSISLGSIVAYQWQFGDGSSSVAPEPDHLYFSSGNFSVGLRAVSDHGCLDTFQFQAKVNPKPVAEFAATDTAGCLPLVTQLADLSAYTGSSAASVVWTIDGTPSGMTSMTPIQLDQEGSYDVGLIITDRNGCVDDTTVKDYLVVRPNPTAAFTVSDSIVSEFEPVVDFTNRSVGSNLIQWDFGDGSISYDTDPRHSYSEPIEYIVTQLVSNQYGCRDTTSSVIKVEPLQSIYIPSAFTPNADNRNDHFKAEGRYIDEYRLTVFDRWGKAIFVATELSDSWDGTFMGTACQQDVYDYLLEYTTKHEGPVKKTGRVTLIR